MSTTTIERYELVDTAAIARYTDKLADTINIRNQWYGVEIDEGVSSPKLRRIGNPALHMLLPIQTEMVRCLLRDDGTVSAYLDPDDSTKTATGEDADLSGASGQVMVEIPEHYRRVEYSQTSHKWRIMMSQYPLPGYRKMPKIYRSAYQAVADRTDPTHPKLSSAVNTTAAFRGGNNNATWDDTVKSLLGVPSTSISLTNFRAYARNRGEYGLHGCGWNCDTYLAQNIVYWLFVVEYANLNSQDTFSAQPDANGYKQGGLGNGVTTVDYNKWSNFNGCNPFIPCGITNSLGNHTGVVPFTMPTEYDTAATNRLVQYVPSYRGIENPFGHISHWADGCKCQIQSDADGGKSLFYSCFDPANFNDTNLNGYNLRGELPRAEFYFKRMMLGEEGDNIATGSETGSSTTYYCDNFWTNIPDAGTAARGVMFGGSATDWSAGGLSFAISRYAASVAAASFGSRLCFYPETA